MAKIPKTVDEYLRQQDEASAKSLGQVRKIILASVPGVIEKISYRIPYYSYKGAFLAFTAQKKHNSLVTMSRDIIKALQKDLKPYNVSGTTIHFPPGKALPAALIKKIVRLRIKEKDAKQ
jgi:uncharacterized protein YdhG (YjbR/CyaY superfamily)